MIALRKIADLDVSAASGAVLDGPTLYIVADDELFLDGYTAATGVRIRRIALLPGALSDEPRARKRAKPDLESLTWLPGGVLLALGSGSTSERARGIALRAAQSLDGPPIDPRIVDLAPLYAAISQRVGALNIEGAAVAGRWLRLLQRGGANADNAVIDLDLDATMRGLHANEPLDASLIVAVHSVSLGDLDGVPLGFTDACPMEVDVGGSRIAFIAVAENTANAYDDGPCAGSVLGVLDEEGRLVCVARFEGHYKLEGLALASPRRGLLLVADPDDRSRRAPLFEAAWPWADRARG